MVRPGRVKSSASRTFAYQGDLLLDRIGKTKRLDRITAADISAYITRRRTEVSDASVNREVGLLRAIMNRAADDLDADIGAPLRWKTFKLTERAERRRTLSEAEEDRLVEALTKRAPDLVPPIAFAILTGARQETVFRLTWSDIDAQAGTLTLRSVKSRRRGEQHVLPLRPAVQAILDAQRGQHALYVFTYRCRRRSASRKPGERYPFSKTGWRRDWEAALKAAVIGDFRFHDLRHTAATRMLRACGNLAAVSKVLGHSSIQMTTRYAHVLMDDLGAAIDAGSRTIPKQYGPQVVLRPVSPRKT